MVNSSGYLSGVTVDGTQGNASPLDMQSNSSTVYVVGGLLLKNATLNLGKADGSTYGFLYFYAGGPQTLGTSRRGHRHGRFRQ